MPFWIIVSSGRGQWKYITPDGPCWKGEISVSFWFFNIVFGWQANLKANAKVSGVLNVRWSDWLYSTGRGFDFEV